MQRVYRGVAVGALVVLFGAWGYAQSRTLIAGTNSASTVAEALAAGQHCVEVVVQNDPDATDALMVGDATSQPIQLEARDSITIPIDNLATVYIRALTTTGEAVANYLCRTN